MLLNPYGVEMGTAGLIIQSQSREEIYADKLLAFAFRPNRIKYRDLWDISWLRTQGIQPRMTLIPDKLNDRNISKEVFLQAFNERKNLLSTSDKYEIEFNHEMHRFLPAAQLQTVQQDGFWRFLVYLINDLYMQLIKI